MIIGNDIVDLKTISANWKHPRFLNKIFTPQEQELILKSNDQHHMIWRLWSMKEAAYKAYMQLGHVRFFNPKRLECIILNETRGTVSIDRESFFTSSTTTEDYVHTFATSDNLPPQTIKIYQTTYSNNKHQSEYVKEKLFVGLSKEMSIPKEQFSIRKNTKGIPVVYKNSEPLNLSFSLSHCGRYVGYVIY